MAFPDNLRRIRLGQSSLLGWSAACAWSQVMVRRSSNTAITRARAGRSGWE
jgi:hypothetical protein